MVVTLLMKCSWSARLKIGFHAYPSQRIVKPALDYQKYVGLNTQRDATKTASQRADASARAFPSARALWYVRHASHATTATIPIHPIARIAPPIFWSFSNNPHCPNNMAQSWSPEPTSGNSCARASAMYVPMYGKFSKNQNPQNAVPEISRCQKK